MASVNLTRATVTGMFWVSWGKAGRALLQLGILAFLARLVSPADFGLVAAALVVIDFSLIFTHLGLGKALIQLPELREEHAGTALSTSVALGLVLGGVVWLAAPLLAAFFRIPALSPVLRLLAWSFPLKGLATVSESLLLRELRFRWLATREVLSYGLGYGLVGVTLASLGWGVWALACGHLAQTLVNTFLLVAGRPVVTRLWPRRGALADLSYFGGGYTLARLCSYAALQADTVVVGRWLGPALLGIYGRAAHLMSVPADLFGDVLDTVLFPTLARTQDDQARLGAAYRRGISLIALVMLPAAATFFVLAPTIVDVVLGPRWAAVVAPFRVFTLGLLFRTSARMSDALSRATGNVYRRAWRQALYAALVVAGAIVGQHWGVSGAALGVLVALVANFALMAQLSLRIAGVTAHVYVAAHAHGAMLAAAAAGSAALSSMLLRQAALPSVVSLPLVLACVVGCLSAAVIGLPSLFVGEDGRWMFHQLLAQYPALRIAAGYAPSWAKPRTAEASRT